ncbi:CCR4-NOT transcription complex subunit 7-like isoform X3 [Monodelphis domestica]|uniref:CCR4-NOT transcription complex subunit 7-like isoform X3 n=1 Tax=Monodelphis domestica TaxID=13616 RepID=UPI0024E2555E|nr:CCR4-NOT transcription complex subunit 7-like isoform X3 [Monodelphis domestica]
MVRKRWRQWRRRRQWRSSAETAAAAATTATTNTTVPGGAKAAGAAAPPGASSGSSSGGNSSSGSDVPGGAGTKVNGEEKGALGGQSLTHWRRSCCLLQPPHASTLPLHAPILPPPPPLPPLQHSLPPVPIMPVAHAEQSPRIREVWACNLDEEMKKMRPVIQQYNYVAMDTEFPGVVARPVGEFRSYADYQYQLLRCNVDWLKIIQLGLTFMNEQGECPPGTSTWQFNFKFNLKEDMYAQDSIELLTMSGIQFKKHEEEGIEAQYFAELLMTSGVVLCDGVKWLSFHSGYDFGYFIKILTNSPLPEEAHDFFEILKLFFPVIYDIKYLMKSCRNLRGGLQEVATQLELERVGAQHQAGSDSLLTGLTFFKMREMFFEDHIDDAKYSGYLYGLGSGATHAYSNSSRAYHSGYHNNFHNFQYVQYSREQVWRGDQPAFLRS